MNTDLLQTPAVYPVGFSIPASIIVGGVPVKNRDFSALLPGDKSTYIYDKEEEYYQNYQESYYAVTRMKAGWDCMRHYEILANGCIPYFLNLDQCPKNVLWHFPKALVLQAMSLPGVAPGRIDHRVFDQAKYTELVEQLLQYTRVHLTTKAMAGYVLQKTNPRAKRVLFLSKQQHPDYLRCLLLHGFRELLGRNLVDVPKIDHLYDTYPAAETSKLYGKGFSYSRRLTDDPEIDRDRIEEKIQSHYFDLVIYGSIHRGIPHKDLVTRHYRPAEIVHICGEDLHLCEFLNEGYRHLFVRELFYFVK